MATTVKEKPITQEQVQETNEQVKETTVEEVKPTAETVETATVAAIEVTYEEQEKANEEPTCETQSEQTEEDSEQDAFNELASLMSSTVEDIKDEFFLYQIHKFMSKIGKVVVRYNITEEELEKLFINSTLLNIDGVTVSPAYFAVCKRVKNKNKLGAKVCSIIDFPFGESTFKAKLTIMREGKGYGMEETMVMMPSMLVDELNIKQFKKQCASIGRRGVSSVALNASDLDEDAIKRAIKATNKTKLSSLTFVFGEATLEEVKSKMAMINANKGLKKISILANVDKAESVTELLKLGVDKIYTPFADGIGKELLEKFKIKGVKAV